MVGVFNVFHDLLSNFNCTGYSILKLVIIQVLFPMIYPSSREL